MDAKRTILCFGLISLLLFGCSADQKQLPTATATIETSKSNQVVQPSATAPSPSTTTDGFLIDTDITLAKTPEAHIARIRYVKLNQALILKKNFKAKNLEPNSTITLNLFPDVTYEAVIEEIQKDAGAITWLGYLDGIEVSSFILIYTADLFIGNFSSPEGVYELSHVENDTYQIILIDQSQLIERD